MLLPRSRPANDHKREPALTRLRRLASEVGAADLLEVLRSVSRDDTTGIPLVGYLVRNLAHRERLDVLARWASESSIAAGLYHLGDRLWAEADLLFELAPLGAEEFLASEQLQGKMGESPVAALASVRPAVYPRPSLAQFLERLRLLVLVRAVEAALETGELDVKLADICKHARHVSESSDHTKWEWFQHIESQSEGFQALADEVADRCARASNTVEGRPGQKGKPPAARLYNALRALVQGEFTFPKVAKGRLDGSGGDTTPFGITTPALRLRASPSGYTTTGEMSHLARVRVEDVSDGPAIIEVEVPDTQCPAAAQHFESNGLILQSIEDVQYLRHSWHRLSDKEEQHFLGRIADLLPASEPVDRVGAALTGLAVLTSTTLANLAAMPVGSNLRDDWVLDLKKGTLRRRPARFGRRWRASEAEAEKWVQPLCEEWRIDLAPALHSVLRGEAPRHAILTVGELWRSVAPNADLTRWFNERFVATEHLQRLTAPVVVSLLPQLTFEHGNDHVLARLVGSSTRTALSSPCAYYSSNLGELRAATAAGFRHPLGVLSTGGVDTRNAAGSELDANVSKIASWVDGLTKAVDEVARDPSRWVEHHNRLTCLVVTALLASTGARPVSSPFESLTWIDTSRSLIYVEDKRSGPTQGSRLCVLTNFARQLLEERYLPHLKDLAAALRPHASGLSAEIDRILEREHECALPFLFFLRKSPSLGWIEVTESRLALHCESWPLPWNAFRHLHSTQLRRRKLHPEIRDALLGHGDRGAESHGDFSWRTPKEDIERARPIINGLMDDLGFRLPQPATFDPMELDIAESEPSVPTSKPYGRQARSLRRQSNHKAARAAARAEIEAMVAGQPLSSLPPSMWDSIAHTMLYREDNLPHSASSLRYEVFEAYLKEAWGKEWRKTGRALQLARSRRVPIREGEAIFTEEVIDAPIQLSKLRTWLDDYINERPTVTDTVGADTAGCLAALELVLHCRVSSFTVLSAVCRNRPSVKVVRFQGRYWLENAYYEEWRDGRPNYRVPITELAAHWIQIAQTGRVRHAKALPIPKLQRKEADPETPDRLEGLVAPHKDFESFLSETAQLAAQVNSYELPGTIAAVLAGRLECAALPHADWIRATHLAVPPVRGNADGATSAEPESSSAALDCDAGCDEVSESHFKHHHRALPSGAADPLTRCEHLFDEVDECLKDEWRPKGKATAPSPAAAGEPGSTQGTVQVDGNRRRSTAIQRAIAQSGFGKGDAPYLFADYARHLLSRDNEKRAGQGLKVSTARRYWDSIKAGVLAFGYGGNLLEKDEDELTEFYLKIVLAAEENSEEDSGAGQRTANELFAFHEFATARYGLEEPDWLEIAPTKVFARGRPGIVLEAEYHAALKALVPSADPARLDDHSLACAFVLLSCGRFGLRMGEAVGMRRGDWLDVHGSVVVLVESNGVRTLKTIASKRQVPLVGQLNDLERAVAAETLNRWQHREGLHQERALLPGVSTSTYRQRKRQIAARLLPLLKLITGNIATTAHHLRHGFACRLLTHLHGVDFGLGLRTDPGTSDTRRLLIGSAEVDRRALWALARTLGHSSPRSSTSYLHTFDSWFPRPEVRRPTKARCDSSRVIDLDVNLDLDKEYLNRSFDVSVEQSPLPSSLTRYFRYLRLKGIGHSLPAEESRLEQDEVDRLEANLLAAATRLPGKPGQSPVDTLLKSVRLARWDALLRVVPPGEFAPLSHTPSQWAATVGRKRQIVLFLDGHFDLARRFLNDLSLTPRDCDLLHADVLVSGLEVQVKRTGLATYCRRKSDRGGAVELDSAVLTEPKRSYADRVVLVPASASSTNTPRIATTQELVVLWVAWLTAVAPRAGGPTPIVPPDRRFSEASAVDR